MVLVIRVRPCSTRTVPHVTITTPRATSVPRVTKIVPTTIVNAAAGSIRGMPSVKVSTIAGEEVLLSRFQICVAKRVSKSRRRRRRPRLFRYGVAMVS